MLKPKSSCFDKPLYHSLKRLQLTDSQQNPVLFNTSREGITYHSITGHPLSILSAQSSGVSSSGLILVNVLKIGDGSVRWGRPGDTDCHRACLCLPAILFASAHAGLPARTCAQKLHTKRCASAGANRVRVNVRQRMSMNKMTQPRTRGLGWPGKGGGTGKAKTAYAPHTHR